MTRTTNEIADFVSGTISGDGERAVSGFASMETAGPEHVSFAGDKPYLERLSECRAGVVLVPCDFLESGSRPEGMTLIGVSNPKSAFIKIMHLFAGDDAVEDRIDPMVRVGDGFKKGDQVAIARNAHIGEGVSMGDRVKIGAGSFIGNGVSLGSDVTIFPNVTILDGTTIGNHVIVQSGSVIGSDGFGYQHDGTRHVKIPHTGTVQIDDHVEIGASNTIDRGTFGKTWLKEGVKTDNQVHIAHNVTVGEHTMLLAQVAVAGSCEIGSNCIIAGQTGIKDHVSIGNGVMIGPKSGISKSVPDGQIVTGAPEMPHRKWLKVQNIIQGLPELRKKLLEVEKIVKKGK